MARIPHGYIESLTQAQSARAAAIDALEPLGASNQPDFTRFDYLFSHLQNDDANLLPESLETVESLRRLGDTMRDPSNGAPPDSQIPAAYTYLGQFIDHDITLEAASDTLREGIDNPKLAPLPLKEALGALRNTRSATLDLDSVYSSPAPREGDKLRVGTVAVSGDRPDGKDDFHDLPRQGRSANPNEDRAALIGDPRNDENLIVAQLHVAFLRAHNALIDQGMDFETARATLRRHYQWIVIHDFLRKTDCFGGDCSPHPDGRQQTL
jgi:hypothetical protein